MNKTTKHYFINLLKRKKKILALYTFVCFMAYPFLEVASIFANGNANGLIDVTQTSFLLALITLGILAAVLPVFAFKFSHTKKHVDTYFSIPINRNHLFKSHFIAPILGACLPILINYLIGGVILVFFKGDFVNYFELLMLLLLAFVLFAVIYSVNTFFVLNTNNVLDSSIITAGIAILPLVFSSAINWFIDSQIINTGMIEIYQFTDEIIKLLLPYTGFVFVAGAFENEYTHLIVDFGQIEWFYILYYVVLGVAFYFLSKNTFKKKKGENAEQLSTSFVTYPLMINIGMISLVLLFNIVQMDFVAAVLVLIALFVVYTIAQAIANRSMTLNAKMILKFVVLIVVINGFNYISKQTEFFGFNRYVIDYKNYDIVEISYYSYSNKYDESEEEQLYNIRIDVNNIKENEKEIFELIKEYQKERSIAFKEKGSMWRDNVYGNLNISYITLDGEKEYVDRNAWFDITEKEETKYIEFYHKLIGE